MRAVAALLLGTLAAALAGCPTQGPQGEPGDPGPQGERGVTGPKGDSVTVTPLAVGDGDCPFGGARVEVDGGVAYACNGPPGPYPVVAVDAGIVGLGTPDLPLELAFAGSGEAPTVARSDHGHPDLATVASLSAYATVTGVQSTLESYATVSWVDTRLADYATIASVDATLQGYETTTSIESRLQDYATIAAVDTKLLAYDTVASVDGKLLNLSGGLSQPGVINATSNPVDWTRLKNVPSGLSDGVDNVNPGDIEGVTAGDGLTGGGSTGVVTLRVAEAGILPTHLAPSAITAVGTRRGLSATTPASASTQMVTPFTIAVPAAGNLAVRITGLAAPDCDSSGPTARVCRLDVALCPAPALIDARCDQLQITYEDPDSSNAVNHSVPFELELISSVSGASHPVFLNSRSLDGVAVNFYAIGASATFAASVLNITSP